MPPAIERNRAILLLSGGVSSAVVGGLAARLGFALHALTVNYGQMHAREIESARQVASWLNVDSHVVLDLPLQDICVSPLTGSGVIPLDRSIEQIRQGGIAPTYVPGRNLILLSLGSAYAESLAALMLFIGVNASAGGTNPDSRGEFLSAFIEAVGQGTRMGQTGQPFQFGAPLLRVDQSEVVKLGVELGLDFGITWSCFRPTENQKPCGRCDSCRCRRLAFDMAGVSDPGAGS